MSRRDAYVLAHEVMDRVGGLAPEQWLEAAAQALQEAPDDTVRQVLLETSVLAPDEVTAAFVLAAVQKGSRRVARLAADLLMDIRRADQALGVISECLRSDDASVRQRAVEALVMVSDPAGVAVLTDTLTSGHASVRRAAVNSLGLMVGSKYHALKTPLLESLSDTSSPLARAILDSDDVQLRRELAQVLSYAASDLVLPVVSGLSQDEDVQVRREAVLSLIGLGTEAAVDAIKGKLGDPDYVVAASVLDALAARYGRNSSELLKALQGALAHPSGEVRRHGVLMLDRYKLPQVEETLLRATRDADFEVQRSALEILRLLGAHPGLDWYDTGAADRPPTQRTLMIWEASTTGAGVEGGGNAAPLLESAAAEGDPSVRAHAINELLQVQDIADSPVLRRALYDRDELVRRSAAGGLSATRDAGFLAEVLQRHPDATVRRSAIETLTENPGGRPGAGAGVGRVEFTSTRTAGMELFGCFLAALEDEDEGVRALACSAFNRYREFACPMPVSVVLRRLVELADDESSSWVMRDTAREAAEKVEDAAPTEALLGPAKAALEWRGRLAREAHALRLDPQSGGFLLEARGGLDPARIAEGWPEELGLKPEQAQAAALALQSGRPLPEGLPQAIMGGLVRGLVCCLDTLHHAAGAVRLAGEARWLPEVEQWTTALRGGPRLDWGEDETVQSWCRLLPRARARAGVSAAAAAEALKDSPDPGALDEACADQDSWVRMAALTARAEMEQDATGSLEELGTLCRACGEDPEFLEVAGPAAIALVGAGEAQFLAVVESALARAHTDLRFELTQKLLVALQNEEAARNVRSYLSGSALGRLSQVCLALALRGAGAGLEGLALPQSAPEGAGVELRSAVLGLRAMLGEQEAVAQLEDALRQREKRRQRYCGAVYLGLARVRSALPVFASVSDQDVPFALRCLCAGMLVRGGHGRGMAWFAQNAGHASPSELTRLATGLARAVEDVIPLMLRCKDVNLGRFV